ncbi:thermonuclease family protein [Neobacillus cucumis]|uniref:thermonuclease family protein n=1 Tax=Neobacillus cucumis TaxID=1740721 RepID=UPI0018DFF98E|nr:thermonuclease family protein [Neobacillus cucumis]MBI0580064.1 thermonuclease family protein [Neobacillus cucumis]
MGIHAKTNDWRCDHRSIDAACVSSSTKPYTRKSSRSTDRCCAPQSRDVIQKNVDSNPSDQVPVSLVETIDGDTLKVKYNRKTEAVGYLLVDTPESKKPGMCVQPYAKEAYFRNKQLLEGGKVTIEFEKGRMRDSYGRLLAYVYVDGKSVQETLLQEGFARVAYIMYPPYKYLRLFKEEENQAKKRKVNVWSRPNYVIDRGFEGCEP